MGYDFHTVRRKNALSLKLSDTEFAMVLSAQHRRGFEHNVHYLRQLVWEDGASMAEPKFVAAATKERWPQQSLDFGMKISAVPRNWEAEYRRLCGMVRAALVLTPELVPDWALQFNVPAGAEPAANETSPASESKPKKIARMASPGVAKDANVRVKRRSGGTK